MNIKENLTWEYLNNVKNTLDSYRIRALIDAKQDIIDAQIYSEDQYLTLLLAMFDLELKKYSLLNFIQESNKEINLEVINQYSHNNSISLIEILSLLELLKSENQIIFEKDYNIEKVDEKITKRFP